MSKRGAAMAEAIVPFAPKSNARAETGDPLDRAGQTILSALDRAAGAAEAKYRQAVETTHKVSAQLRAAEDQIRELEGKARYQENRADRAEKWLYQISLEIEQKFLGRADASPAPQSVSRTQQQ
jgi:ABC-type transporter Mla subunit MlaD